MDARRAGVFERNGLAALSDLESAEWVRIFDSLEKKQSEFLARQRDFISPKYKWPRDPLHTWSRVWEYPYIYYNLKRWYGRAHAAHRMPRVVDLGSGTTFFPFAVARLGTHVTCVDIDAIVERDLSRAVERVSPQPGKIDFQLSDGADLPFGDGEIDALYSISVMEHIPQCERVVSEIARILGPGGFFGLTFDLDLRGNQELGPGGYHRLRSALGSFFEPVHPEPTVHVADILRSDKGPCPSLGPRGLQVPWFLIKQWLIKPVLGRKPRLSRLPYLLAVMGLTLRRR